MSAQKPKIGDYMIVREKALIGASYRWYVYERKRALFLFPMWKSVNVVGFKSDEAAREWAAERRRPAGPRYL